MRPTRITSSSATLIDHIFINQYHCVSKSGDITADISDHLATYVNILLKDVYGDKFRDENLNNEQTKITAETLANFKKELSNLDKSSNYSASSADEKLNIFLFEYNEIYKKNY